MVVVLNGVGLVIIGYYICSSGVVVCLYSSGGVVKGSVAFFNLLL